MNINELLTKKKLTQAEEQVLKDALITIRDLCANTNVSADYFRVSVETLLK